MGTKNEGLVLLQKYARECAVFPMEVEVNWIRTVGRGKEPEVV